MYLPVDKALRKAQSHIKAGELAEAEELYKQVLFKFPKNKKAIQGYQKLKTPPQEKLNNVITLYNKGNLEKTASLAEKLAKQYPNALILYDILGAAYLGLKNADKTIESYQKALRLKPNHTDAHNNMGLALYDQGRFHEAVESYQKAVRLEPDFADAHYNLGNALKQTGDLKQAIESYRASIAINPNDSEVLSNYGNALKDYGNFDHAIKIYAKALKVNPNFTATQKNMDNAIEEKSEIDKNVADYARVAKLEIGSARLVSFAGSLLKAKGHLDAAIDSYKQALKIKPDYADAYYNMGIALKDKGELDAAIDSYKQAIKIKPDYADAYGNMGAALNDKGELDAAMEFYKQGIKIKPDHVEIHYNMGVALMKGADFDLALNCSDRALRIKPDYLKAQLLKSQLLLNCQEFELGWRLYANYFYSILENQWDFVKRVKRWDGASLRGKNIQVYVLQGVGDEIFFSSCIPDLIELSPKQIYLECDPRLKVLFERSFPGVIAYGRARTEKLAEIFDDTDIPNIERDLDYSILMEGLPQFFRNRLEDFPKKSSFLLPDPKLVKKWSKRLKAIGDGLKVGISWRGGSEKAKNQNSIPLRLWQDLLSADAFFINLQYGETSDEVSKFSAENGIKIYDWEDNDASVDLDNQAALISELDLVISVDNATVHSCIALGTEVWDLIDWGANLMWLDNDTMISPISSHLRMFKKKRHDNWGVVLKQVEICLADKINS